MLKKTLKKEGGFTLLELLIVIVIIGILAALIIPNITSGPKKGRDAVRTNDLKAVRNALEEYYTDKSIYPTTANIETALTGGTPPIMKALPKDPKTKVVYSYTSADGTSYTLKACLENTNVTASDTILADTSCGTGGKALTFVNNN